ncbi:MAG TPA: STAS domain-containing protein [Anaerolineales bacterium]|nr:STAS domain-containing protein [Anaerolineales bacterium]
MNITSSTAQGKVAVSILHLDGKLDSASYKDFIGASQKLFDNGVRNLLIDLRNVSFMSSAGLVALHTVGLLFGGRQAETPEGSGKLFRSINPQADRLIREHVKLLGPQSNVAQVLDTVGLKQFFQIFDDLDQAVNSFEE